MKYLPLVWAGLWRRPDDLYRGTHFVNGVFISTLGGASFDSQLVYALVVTHSLVVIAIVVTGSVGLLGGAFPAIRVARASVADALHET